MDVSRLGGHAANTRHVREVATGAVKEQHAIVLRPVEHRHAPVHQAPLRVLGNRRTAEPACRGAVHARVQVIAEPLPTQVSDGAFWRMIAEFSEPEGLFRSDNFVSNETTYQEVIPELKKRSSSDGVYLGVGPDQNFTYIAALRPRMAFIVDVRRQNMILHLLYKAIIERSVDRSDFLSRLFSRPRPAGLEESSTPKALFDAYREVAGDEMLFQRNLQDVENRLVEEHGFPLTEEDLRSLEYVYRAFFSEGPDLRYSFPRQQSPRWFPTYAELIMATDRTGLNHSYLADELNFRTLREFQRNNLLIPIVGDFGGDKAIRAVGGYLAEHGATVNYFYTSNVEQYLFQNDAWRRYYASVGGPASKREQHVDPRVLRCRLRVSTGDRDPRPPLGAASGFHPQPLEGFRRRRNRHLSGRRRTIELTRRAARRARSGRPASEEKWGRVDFPIPIRGGKSTRPRFSFIGCRRELRHPVK